MATPQVEKVAEWIEGFPSDYDFESRAALPQKKLWAAKKERIVLFDFRVEVEDCVFEGQDPISMTSAW